MSVFSRNLDQVKYEIRLEIRRKDPMMTVGSTSVTATSGCSLSRSVEACKSTPFVHEDFRVAMVQYLHRTLHLFLFAHFSTVLAMV